MDRPLVPKRINRKVRYLISHLGLSNEPTYVEVRPVENASINNCFINVSQVIENSEGTMVVGWSIWETKNLIEAIYHSIWKTPDGDLLDITSKEFPTNVHLFIEDSKIEYDGSTKDNVRLNMSGNPLVDDIIKLSEAEYIILNKVYFDHRNREYLVNRHCV